MVWPRPGYVSCRPATDPAGVAEIDGASESNHPVSGANHEATFDVCCGDILAGCCHLAYSFTGGWRCAWRRVLVDLRIEDRRLGGQCRTVHRRQLVRLRDQ